MTNEPPIESQASGQASGQDRAGIREPWKNNYRPEMVELMAKLWEILNRWRRDNSDSMVDYFDVNYYRSLIGPDGISWAF